MTHTRSSLPPWLVLCPLLLAPACSDCSESEPADSTGPQTEVEDQPTGSAEAPGAEEGESGTPADSSGRPAGDRSRPYVERYREAVAAYNARHADEYFASFADPVSCFYGKTDVPLDDVRSRRWADDSLGTLAVADLRVLSSDDDEALLLDRGYFAGGPDGERQVVHEKLVLMRRDDGGKPRIAAETNREGAGCLGERRPAKDVLSRPESFAQCKSQLSKCAAACEDATCRRRCGNAAMTCLGLSAPRDAPPRSTGDGSATVASEDDVARFVRLAIALQYPQHHAGGEPTDDERAWYWNAAESLGGPRWRTSELGPWEQLQSACSWFVYPSNASRAVPTAVDSVRCADDMARCVAWLETDAGDDERVDLHLLFGQDGDGRRLRVAYSNPLQPVEAPDGGGGLPEVPEQAQAQREQADGACDPMREAVLLDRAGDDVWETFAMLGIPDPDWPDGATAAITRHCGDRAEAAVRSWGDGWRCDGLRCEPWSMCGNSCRSLRGVRDGDEMRVLAMTEGEHGAEALGAEQVDVLRPQVGCGQTVYASDLDSLELVE